MARENFIICCRNQTALHLSLANISVVPQRAKEKGTAKSKKGEKKTSLKIIKMRRINFFAFLPFFSSSLSRCSNVSAHAMQSCACHVTGLTGPRGMYECAYNYFLSKLNFLETINMQQKLKLTFIEMWLCTGRSGRAGLNGSEYLLLSKAI